MRWLAVVSVGLVTLAGCGSGTEVAETTTPDVVTSSSSARQELSVRVTRDVAYSSTFSLDVYQPEPSDGWPVAVVFHGGGGTKEEMAAYATQVAEEGVVVFVPHFRSTPPDVAEGLDVAFEDGACAIRFAREHATEYGANAERVVVAGLSYGGDVAAVMLLAGDEFGEGCVVGEEVSAAADGLVGLDGLYDAVAAAPALGWEDAYTLEQLEAASATSYVAASVPNRRPVVLFTGSEPGAIEQAGLFRTELESVGYEVVLEARPDVPHTVLFPTQAKGAVEALVAMARESE